MSDREKVLWDSIQKLRKLNVADDEIIAYLKEFGVNTTDARRLLAEKDRDSTPDMPPQSAATKMLQDNRDSLESDFEPPVLDDLVVASSKTHFKKQKSDSPPAVASHAPAKQTPVPQSGSDELEGLWKKGILQTATDSLVEMREIRSEIDELLDARVAKAMTAETKKLQALSENLRALLMAKVNAQLEEKSAEIVETLDARIAELKQKSEEFRQQRESFKTERKLASELFKELSEALAHSRELSQKTIRDFNSEMMKSKSEVAETVAQARQKLLALEERATKTLALESAIIDNLVKESRREMQDMGVEKIGELTSEVASRITEFDALKKDIDRQLDEFSARLRRLEAKQ